MSGNPPGAGGRGRGQLPFHPRGGGGRGGRGGGDRGGRGGGDRGRGADRGRGGDRGRGFDRGRGGGDRGGYGGRGRGGGGGPSREIEVYGGGAVPRPDATVARIEGETEAAWKKAASANATAPGMPQRPGFGTVGRQIVLWANFFSLSVSSHTELEFFRYSLKVTGSSGTPDPTGKKLRRVVRLLLEDHLSAFEAGIVTDFASNLFSRVQLNDATYQVRYRGEGEDEAPPDAKTYAVRVALSGSMTVSDLLDHISSPEANRSLQSKEEIVQALTLVAGQYAKADSAVVNVGANRHYPLNPHPVDKFDLGGGLVAVRGFFMSVRTGTARLMVNVQVKNGAFFQSGPLANLMSLYGSQNGYNKPRLASFLRRLSVDVTHITNLNKAGQRIPRFKSIAGLATRDDGRKLDHPPMVSEYGAGARDVKFWLSESGPGGQPSGPGGQSSGKKKKGKQSGPKPQGSAGGKYISVYDHFAQNYPQVKIDQRLPVVNVGTKDHPSYIPVDACFVVPGQVSNSKLSPDQTQKMIRFAVRKPGQNAECIVSTGSKLLGFDAHNATLASWGMKVDPQLLTVSARVLTAPEVKYSQNKSAAARFGSWNMAGVQFSACPPLSNWTYLNVVDRSRHGPCDDDATVKQLVAEFTMALRAVGISATDALPGMRIEVNPMDPGGAVDLAIQRFKKSNKAPPTIVLVVLPSVSTAIYRAVKFACDVTYGLVNVCVVAKSFARGGPQYYANVALKFNLKLGGRNQTVPKDKLGIIGEGKTMVVGLDVTHPAPGSAGNAPSVASIVASVDPWLAQWPADLRIQKGRQEKVSDLAALMTSRLVLWRAKQGQLPENVLVYRDGVSEGQYKMVVEEELPELKRACDKLYPPEMVKKSLPRITVVVVGKRHHTRFYPTRKEDADRSSNAPNGTIVDRGVTEARGWDFYLQAHAALQGTARPAHYFVVHDEIFTKTRVPPPFKNAADVLESLTHNMCYLFGRATKAVSLCPPAYYSDLACDRSRCYLGGLIDASVAGSQADSVTGMGADAATVVIHPDVKDTMFYI